jgi:hypothetical protein
MMSMVVFMRLYHGNHDDHSLQILVLLFSGFQAVADVATIILISCCYIAESCRESPILCIAMYLHDVDKTIVIQDSPRHSH